MNSHFLPDFNVKPTLRALYTALHGGAKTKTLFKSLS
jgi:hypothetical protein